MSINKTAKTGMLAMLVFLLTQGSANGQVKGAAFLLKSTCAYGCWAGATAGLRTLDGVTDVHLLPKDRYANQARYGTIQLDLKDGRLPNVARWREQFTAFAHEAYVVRGVELTVEAVARMQGDSLILESPNLEHPVKLASMNAIPTGATQPSEPDLEKAYEHLCTDVRAHGGETLTLSVTGLIEVSETGYVLHVSKYTLVSPGSGK